MEDTKNEPSRELMMYMISAEGSNLPRSKMIEILSMVKNIEGVAVEVGNGTKILLHRVPDDLITEIYQIVKKSVL